MKQTPSILTICSTIDFVNFTRRATLEAIWKKHQQIDFVLYTGLKNIFKPKNVLRGPKFRNYHFWIPEQLKQVSTLSRFEYTLRSVYWKKLFQHYEYIFFTDPNQYYLLPYVTSQKVIYLIRDPHCLFNPDNYPKEIKLIRNADIQFCTSKYLAEEYVQKYYNHKPKRSIYWPNTVDTELWDFEKYRSFVQEEKKKPVAGLLGNLTDYTDDFELLDYITSDLPQVNFELSGKISKRIKDLPILQNILKKNNVKHCEFLQFDLLPSRVINWDIGLIIAQKENELSRYIHNNKQLQYLALGKPFVTYDVHGDYNDFEDMVFLAENKKDFVSKILQAIARSEHDDALNKGMAIAQRNSSEKRAEQFINVINQQ